MVGLLGGVGDIVAGKMKRDEIYDDFVKITQREYGSVFGEEGEGIVGEDFEFCYPNVSVPEAGVKDFISCM